MEDEKKVAPHGRDDAGQPLTPFGVNLDGTPRKSNRGARPGQRSNGARSRGRSPRVGSKATSPTDAQRREMLLGLGEMVITGPLAALSMSPLIAKRFGKQQADALAGDAVILTQYMPGLAEGLIVLSQSKPGALTWLDQVEEKAPYLLLANVGVQVAKALVGNHLNPNPDLARAGRLQLAMNQQAMIANIEAAAAEMGIDLNEEPTIPIPTDKAA